MFDRFVKGGASGGHGLGLAFTRAIVLAHGGGVAAHNRVDGGTRVVVTLERPPRRSGGGGAPGRPCASPGVRRAAGSG